MDRKRREILKFIGLSVLSGSLSNLEILVKPVYARIRFFTIATATPGGTYYPVGTGLATLWTEKLKGEGIRISAQSSAGSVENINMLRDGEAEFAILQGLIGSMAWKGEGVFKGRAYKGLRCISALWPNVEHFVLIEKKVKTGNVLDIKGTHFCIGRAGSGTERSTLTIMGALGMSIKDIKPEYLGYGDAARAIKDGTIDGGAFPAGPPVAAVSDLFATPNLQVRILEFTDKQLKMVKENSLYPAFRYVLPPNTYMGQKQPIRTIAQPNFLGVRKEVDPEVVYKVTKVMYENLPYLRRVHKACRFIKLESALSGLPAPLHLGAYKYYKEQGLRIPQHLLPPEIA